MRPHDARTALLSHEGAISYWFLSIRLNLHTLQPSSNMIRIIFYSQPLALRIFMDKPIFHYFKRAEVVVIYFNRFNTKSIPAPKIKMWPWSASLLQKTGFEPARRVYKGGQTFRIRGSVERIPGFGHFLCFAQLQYFIPARYCHGLSYQVPPAVLVQFKLML